MNSQKSYGTKMLNIVMMRLCALGDCSVYSLVNILV